MRLKNQKKSKGFRDETWVPKVLSVEEDGSLFVEPAGVGHNSILTNPNGYLGLDYYDLGELESGGDLQSILFRKALHEYREKYGKPLIQRKRK